MGTKKKIVITLIKVMPDEAREMRKFSYLELLVVDAMTLEIHSTFETDAPVTLVRQGRVKLYRKRRFKFAESHKISFKC